MPEYMIFTSEMFEDAEIYWKNKLAGELDDLDIRGDYSRTGHYIKAYHKMTFSGPDIHELTHISKNNDLLLYIILLSVFKILISRYSGQDDIIVVSPVLKKSGQGYNTFIALKDILLPGMTFKEFLKAVKETVVEGYKHQHYPIWKLIKLLKWDDGPLFRYMFLLTNIHEHDGLEEIIEKGENDLIFSMDKLEGNLAGEITYNSQVFTAETIKRLEQCYMCILRSALSDTGAAVSNLEIMTPEEKKKLLFEFNDTQTSYPHDKTIHELFAQQVAQTPDVIALVARETREKHEKNEKHVETLRATSLQHITYFQLNEQSNHLAGLLSEKGVRPDHIVAIMMKRSIEMVIGFLGILKAGGAYLPIDPNYPQERIDYMLKDSNVKVLITNKSEIRNPKLETNPNKTNLNDQNKKRNSGVSLVLNFEHLNFDIVSNFDIRASNLFSSNLAYVIYTSGSTGKPKGVMIEHQNVIRLLKDPVFIDFKQDDRLLPTGAAAFDISVFEILAPLLNGAQLYLYSADRYGLLEPGRLGQILSQHKISILHLIPQLFNQMVSQKIEIFASLRYLLVGGDIVRPAYINSVRERFRHLKILQMYGPTENTIFTTYFPIEKTYPGNIPIGKPIANTTVYIVDKNKQIQPISAAGELWTGGDGVARGYMNHPELTNDQFIFTRVAFEKAPLDPAKLLFNYHSPLTTHHSPIYKTGDLARWLPGGPPAGGDSGGVIEFLGRIDNQLKIRGVRIEPAEIEKQLLTKNGIKEALVDVRMHEHKTAGENFTEKYLCAYIVSENKIDPSELREHLSTALPDYMIPSFFVFLEKFPVTPNGKIDRNALPFPVLDTSGQYSPPQSELEEKLVEIWSEILRIKKDIIGIDNNFFELGGNSLNATLFIGKLHQEMNVKLPVGEVFRKPKIRELAQSIKASAKNVFSAIEPTEKKEYYPMSSAQKRLYTLRQMEAESTAYNMPVILILAGIPRQDRLMDTFAELIKRHESLRTSFDIIDKQMVQVIHETVAFAMEYNEPGPGEEREIIHAFEKPFNLNQAPLLRAGLVRTPGETYVLMIDTHHIIMDGFSLGILQQEFISIYNGEELPGLTLTYKDYSQWQNSEKGKETLKKQENYWLKQLSGELPVLNIPTDFPRPKIQRFSADAVDFEIRDEWYGLLKKLSLRENTTVHILLVTVFNIFLARLSGQEDIITGITMPGRTGIHLEKVVGLVTNTLVLRSFPYKYKDFLHYLAEVKEKSADAYENQDYPLEYIVDKLQVNREPGRNPIFDFMFEVMNDLTPVGGENTGENKGEKSTLNFRPYPYQRQISVFDMIWTGNDTGNVVRFCVSYRVDLFKRDSIELMIDYYLALVKQILTGSRVKIKDLTHWPPVAEQTNMEINFKF